MTEPGGDREEVMEEPGGLIKVPLPQLDTKTLGNPRKERQDLDGLRASIEREGLKNPPRVWVRRIQRGGTRVREYLVASGFGRIEAIATSEKLRKEFKDGVPCLAVTGTEAEIRLGQLVEQVQHEDWNPIDVADAAINLTKEPADADAPKPMPLSTVAEAAGKTEKWLTVLINVRQKCTPPVLAAVRSGRLPVSEAAKWIRFDAAKQNAMLKEYLATKAAKGTRAANKEARERAASESPDRVVKPKPKEIAEVRSAMGILSSAPEWKLAMDALDWVAGRNKAFPSSVAKAVDGTRKQGGRSNGKDKAQAQEQAL